MGKTYIKYVCNNCGYETAKWFGKCPDCRQWNTMIEETYERKPKKSLKASPQPVSLIDIDQSDIMRLSTGMSELDRVLGGGLIPGSLILLGGDPGIGKSTLLLQIADYIAHNGKRILYISGEESLQQIRRRSLRLNINNADIHILNEQNLDLLENSLSELNPDLVIIDSIQTVYLDSIDSIPGSVSQLRECTARIMSLAKKTQRIFFMIGHVTKEGALAGPRILEHMVDVVIYFEGEKNYAYRILRGVKNRFGSTDEIGLLEMSSAGLLEVTNPANLFLHERKGSIYGSVVVAGFEGSRPLLIEVQALVSSKGAAYPRRMASGIDQNRLALIMAVLEKKCAIDLSTCDVYLKITGGLFLKDPSVDLGIAAAILSSYLEKPLSATTVFTGELALSGEIRPVPFLGARIREVTKMGFASLVIAAGIRDNDKRENSRLNIIELESINDLIIRVLGRVELK